MFGPAGPNGPDRSPGSLGARTSAGVRNQGREAYLGSRSGAARGSGSRGLLRRITGYEHLVPLFREMAALAPDDPRRAELRNWLVTGYLPVAQHARKHGYRGEVLEDLEQVATLGLIQAIDHFGTTAARTSCPSRSPPSAASAPALPGPGLGHPRAAAAARAAGRTLPGRRRPQPAPRLHGPAPLEIAARLGPRSMRSSTGYRPAAGHCLSLDEPASEEVELGRPDPLRGRSRPRRPGVGNGRSSGWREPLIAQLPIREQTILMLQFFGGLTQTEITRHIGISQMRLACSPRPRRAAQGAHRGAVDPPVPMVQARVATCRLSRCSASPRSRPLLPDALQPVPQRAAVDGQRRGRLVVAAAAVEIRRERRDPGRLRCCSS